MFDYKSYVLSKKYTDETIVGGGALKGKNATIKSITHDDANNRSVIVFAWYLDDGREEETTLYVPDGQDGISVVGVRDVSVPNDAMIVFVFSDGSESDPVHLPMIPGFSPTVEAVVDTPTEYILKITTIEGDFLTPNLRGDARDYNLLINKPAVDGVQLDKDTTFESISGISSADITAWNDKSKVTVNGDKMVVTN